MSASTAEAMGTGLSRSQKAELALRHLRDPEEKDWIQHVYITWQMFSDPQEAMGILLDLCEQGLVVMRSTKRGGIMWAAAEQEG